MRKKYKNTLNAKICILVLIAPAVIHLLLFWLGVQIETIKMTFTDVSTGELSLTNFEWAYRNLFAGGSVNDINLAFVNTMKFFCMSMALIPIAVFFAYLIYRKTFAHGFMRIALYLPGAISGLMMAILYEKLMGSDGPIMQLIQSFNGSTEPFMFRIENGVLYIMIYDILVGVGGNLMIWLGSMSRIPYDLIEYGKLEGIKPIREFVTVVLPLIWPTFVTVVSLAIIGLFGSSGSVQVLTDGQYGTYTLAFWMYKMVQAGQSGEYNHVAALGIIFTVLTIPLVVIFRKIMNRFGGEVEY